MMGIMRNALRERIRRKDIYVVIVLGLLIALMCMSGTVTLSIDGVAVTEVRMLLPLVLNVVSVVGGGMAVALSLRTIPNEYERKVSHLVWMRGISQWNYHGQLALANMVSSVGALFILYAGMMVFAAVKGETGVLIRSIPGFALYAAGTAGVSLFTSAVSLIFPGMAAGVLAAAVMLAGTMQPVLRTLSGIVSGMPRGILRGILAVTPDLYAASSQAGEFLLGKKVDAHSVLGGLLFLYAGAALLYIVRKKECA